MCKWVEKKFNVTTFNRSVLNITNLALKIMCDESKCHKFDRHEPTTTRMTTSSSFHDFVKAQNNKICSTHISNSTPNRSSVSYAAFVNKHNISNTCLQFYDLRPNNFTPVHQHLLCDYIKFRFNSKMWLEICWVT